MKFKMRALNAWDLAILPFINKFESNLAKVKDFNYIL